MANPEIAEKFTRFKGKRALVMGLGLWQGGVEAVKFLHRWGASQILVTDLRDEKTLAPSLEAIKDIPVTLRLGEHREADFARAQVVIHSPAVRPDNKYLVAAREAGAEVTQEMSLFIEACPAFTIGITGSNGKTTTTLLAYEMLCGIYERAQPELEGKWADPVPNLPETGQRVWLGGNVGTPLINRLEEIEKEDVVVLELSSFQLMDWHRIQKSCLFALITNITANHLDWHKDFDEYVWAKSAIFRYQNEKACHSCVVNADDPVANAFREEFSRLYVYSIRGVPTEWIHSNAQLLSWGYENGLYSDQGTSALRWLAGERPPAPEPKRSRSAEKLKKERTPKLPFGRKNHPGEQQVAEARPFCARADLRLPGDFNWSNLAGAWAVVQGLFVHGGFGTVIQSIRRFRGVEHRLEPCGSINGARVYNDSIATDPAATLAALSAFDKCVHLILGGGSKNIDYTELGKRIATHCGIKAIYLQGTTAPAIKAAIGAASIPMHDCATFDEACERAFKALMPGDVLLMSPASTSFYEYAPGKKFANFEERGKHFKALVARASRPVT